MSSNKIQQYTENEMHNKDGFELLLEAFSAIMRGMDKAKKAIEEKDYLEQNRVLNACSNLLIELRNSLPRSDNFEELRASLVNIFSYAEKKILDANRTQDINILEEVKALFSKIHNETDTMKMLPNFKEIQKANQKIIDSAYSKKRISIDNNPKNEDLLQFLTAYQESNYKKVKDLHKDNSIEE